MSGRPTLALAIPSHNDGAELARLLTQARALRRFDQIVVVDDGSDSPVPEAPDLTLIRHDSPQGGGAARNRALAAVTADYVLCFDADDLLAVDALGHLLDDLWSFVEERGFFDLCLFKYADGREARAGHWGQPGWDERFWAATGASLGALVPLPPAARPLLAQTANYPWNKIYRTALLHDHAIACTETPVHNDVALHWGALTAAERVLSSDRVCAWHQLRPGAGRLSNRTGPERLTVIAALAPAWAAAAQADARMEADAADLPWQRSLATFALGLTDWVAERIGADDLSALRAGEAAMLTEALSDALPQIEAVEPALAARLRLRMEAAA